MTARGVTRSRLSRFVGLPDGLTPNMALAQADLNLQAHRQAVLKDLDAAIAATDAILAHADSPSRAAQQALFRTAYEIAGLAGLYDLAALGAAARSLCDLIDLCRQRQVWNAPGVAVHLAAVRLLRRPDLGGGGAEQEILRGLARIVQR
jgi:hypothetical protein